MKSHYMVGWVVERQRCGAMEGLRSVAYPCGSVPEASAITQHYQGFCWVSRSLNPTLYLRGMLEEVVSRNFHHLFTPLSHLL